MDSLLEVMWYAPSPRLSLAPHPVLPPLYTLQSTIISLDGLRLFPFSAYPLRWVFPPCIHADQYRCMYQKAVPAVKYGKEKAFEETIDWFELHL